MVSHRRRTSLRRRPILVIILIILILVIALAVSKFIASKNQPEETKREETVKVEEKTEKTPTESTDEDLEKPKVVQNDGADPNELEEITGVVTYTGVLNGKLIIRLNLDQYLSSGNCTLTLNFGEKSVIKTAKIIDSASTSTCEGFDIPTSELGSGTWQYSVEIKADGKAGKLNGEVNI